MAGDYKAPYFRKRHYFYNYPYFYPTYQPRVVVLPQKEDKVDYMPFILVAVIAAAIVLMFRK